MIIKNTDKWDEKEFTDSLESNSELSALNNVGMTKMSEYTDFMFSIFAALYKYTPQVLEDGEISTRHDALSKKMYNEVSSLPEWQLLREKTKLNSLLSTEATIKFCKETIDKMPQPKIPKKQPPTDTLEAVNHRKSQWDQGQEKLMDGIRDAMERSINDLNPPNEPQWEQRYQLESTDDQDGCDNDNLKEEIEKLEAQNILNGQSLDYTNGFLNEFRSVARSACEEAFKEVDELESAIETFCEHSSNYGRTSNILPSEKLKIANMVRNNKKIKEIADLAGKFKNIALTKQRQKLKSGVDEITNICTGDDISKLIPSELSKIKHPLLKYEFRKKFLEKNLLQYELKSKENVGKGPIVLCIDESYSMTEDGKHVWSKAIAMALLSIAQKQKRNFSMIHFDTSVKRTDTFKADRRVDPRKLMAAMNHFSGGGTNFEQPIFRALKVIAEDKDDADADIVFITDGESSINKDILKKIDEFKDESQTEIISVIIDSHDSRGPNTCYEFSDKVFRLSDVLKHQIDDGSALDTIFSL